MEETMEWLEKAGKDIRTAEVNLKQGIYDASAFFSQQAAEKALKALYIKKKAELWRTHDLGALAKKLGAEKKMTAVCDSLTEHYIATRYPTEAKYGKPDAEEALSQSREVVEWVRKTLSRA
jgi:HEPN domain-containing protein